MSSVKNSYIALNADPTKKDVQPAGVFYDYDEKSIYINFNFDDTIDLSDIQEGFVCLRFKTEKINDLILDINFIENSNSGFVVLPEEYTTLLGTHTGEVNLKYQDNSMTVGHFEIVIEKSIVQTQAKSINDVYVPRFNETIDMYNKLREDFEGLGLGTFEDAVRAVQNNNGILQKLYPSLQGLVENNAVYVDGSDTSTTCDIPYGISYGQASNFSDLPDSISGDSNITFIRTGLNESGDGSLLAIDSSSGQIWIKSTLSTDSYSDIGWTKFTTEISLWKNKTGQILNGSQVNLSNTVDKFSRVKIRARFLGTESEFLGSKDGVVLTQTNINDSDMAVYFAEGKITFGNTYNIARLENMRVYKVDKTGGLKASEGDFYITEIIGVL